MDRLTLALLIRVRVVFIQVGTIWARKVGTPNRAFIFTFFTHYGIVLISHISQVFQAVAVAVDLEVVASLANALSSNELEVLVAIEVCVWGAAWAGGTLGCFVPAGNAVGVGGGPGVSISAFGAVPSPSGDGSFFGDSYALGGVGLVPQIAVGALVAHDGECSEVSVVHVWAPYTVV